MDEISFAAVASPVRLRLLGLLREPRALSQIRLVSSRAGERERTVARQTVREHLDKLLEAGVVVAITDREKDRSPRYVVDPAAIEALADQMRAFAIGQRSVATQGGEIAKQVASPAST